MKETLYDKLTSLDEQIEELKDQERVPHHVIQYSIQNIQEGYFNLYESNPVIVEALNEGHTIESQFDELEGTFESREAYQQKLGKLTEIAKTKDQAKYVDQKIKKIF